MAGMAISPLLNMKGENAMAIAWAAFCIPTSMTMVRRTAGVNFQRHCEIVHYLLCILQEKYQCEEHQGRKCRLAQHLMYLLGRHRAEMAEGRPGKYGHEQQHQILQQQLTHGQMDLHPGLLRDEDGGQVHYQRQGEQGYHAAQTEARSIIRGSVNRVITLLIAVSVTDRATSPFASMENTLEELPPGQQAMSTSPMK